MTEEGQAEFIRISMAQMQADVDRRAKRFALINAPASLVMGVGVGFAIGELIDAGSQWGIFWLSMATGAYFVKTWYSS